jgi:hypothetical protein
MLNSCSYLVLTRFNEFERALYSKMYVYTGMPNQEYNIRVLLDGEESYLNFQTDDTGHATIDLRRGL